MKMKPIIAVLLGLPGVLQGAESANPSQMLATVVQRDFLYNIGLSEPGTLGVGFIRYQVDVADVWRESPGVQVGSHITLLAPGGCEQLMQKNQRYLFSIEPLQAGPVIQAEVVLPALALNEQPGTYWVTDCKITGEQDASESIAALNQERQLRLSAN